MASNSNIMTMTHYLYRNDSMLAREHNSVFSSVKNMDSGFLEHSLYGDCLKQLLDALEELQHNPDHAEYKQDIGVVIYALRNVQKQLSHIVALRRARFMFDGQTTDDFDLEKVRIIQCIEKIHLPIVIQKLHSLFQSCEKRESIALA